MFIVRQMIEKRNEHGLDLHMLFFDLKQAFDSINRKRLFEAVDKMGISQKLIRLIRTTMSQTKARVKTDNQISAPFEFNPGVKQGDGLSTSLFILALRNAAREIDRTGTVHTKSSQISACADDILIVTKSEIRLGEVYRVIVEETQQMGLTL